MKVSGGDWVQGKGYVKKILADAEDLGEGSIAQVVTIKAGEKVEPHYHEEATEFYYILEGEAELGMAGEEYHAVPGDAYLVRPGDVHSVTNDTDKDFTLIVFKRGWETGDLIWS
jgi:quercetin dioxygenase-like cupin family protein